MDWLGQVLILSPGTSCCWYGWWEASALRTRRSRTYRCDHRREYRVGALCLTTFPCVSSSRRQVMVYQGMEPLKPRAFVVTRATSSENVIGVFGSEMRIAREITSYLSSAIVLTLLQPFPRI